MSSISKGPDHRAREPGIAQSKPGLRDDSGPPVEASDKEIEEARRKLRKGDDTADSIKLERQFERPKHGTA